MAKHYEPMVPIVEEIRLELLEAARTEIEAERGAERGPVRRRLAAQPPRRREWPRRVARRVAPLVALIVLIGGVALAARFGLGGEKRPADTRPAEIAASPGWTLSAFLREWQPCVELVAGDQPSVACEPAGNPVTSALAPGRRLVAGLVAGRVVAVLVEAEGERRRAAVRRPLDPTAAAEAGLPAGSRWFLVALPRHAAGRAAPARVTALDRAGQRVGAVAVDCSLGSGYGPCLGAARRQAEALLP